METRLIQFVLFAKPLPDTSWISNVIALWLFENSSSELWIFLIQTGEQTNNSRKKQNVKTPLYK